MNTFNKKVASGLLVLAIIFPKIILAQESSIVITEVGAHESSNYEWIEIYNPASNPVDLTDWVFYENETNHGLNESQGDLVIEPGEYAIIADVPENFLTNHPDFEGTVIDSSWSTLKESGEEIGLKDSQGNIVMLFTYPQIDDTSMQRLEPSSDSGWEAHADSDSAGGANEFGNERGLDNTDDADSDNSSVSLNTTFVAGSVVINEIMADPDDGQEWIELYNNNQGAVDLSEWTIKEGSGATFRLSGSIAEKGFYLYELSAAKLNNGGDAVYLYDPGGNKIDYIVYGNWNDDNLGANNAPVGKEGQSIARKVDGGTTNQNSADFAVTTLITPELPNVISGPQSNELASQSTADDRLAQATRPAVPVIINEIFPNPVGSDRIYEFVELKNISEEPVNLKGWKIQDASGVHYRIGEVLLNPNGEIAFERSQTSIALDNNQDEVRLINALGEIADRVKYKQPFEENYSYQLIEKTWRLTTKPTKGVENKDYPINQPPVIKLYCPKEIELHESFVCDASDSYDPHGDSLRFLWRIGKKEYVHDYMRMQIDDPANDAISLQVTDGELSVTKIIRFKIKGSTEKTQNLNTEVTENKDGETASANETIVTAQGAITVAPDTFSKNIAYIDGNQVVMDGDEWPELKVGEIVKVTGSPSISYGQERIKITKASDIQKTDQTGAVNPIAVSIRDIGEEYQSRLVTVSGTVMSVAGNSIILSDGIASVEVYLKQKTGISAKLFRENQEVTVTGIVAQYKDSYQLLPRSTEDIDISTAHTPPVEAAEDKASDSVIEYEDPASRKLPWTEILIGLAAVGLGLTVVVRKYV